MSHRVREALLWGAHRDVHQEDGITITSATGTYGTFYEVQCRSLWRYWRLHAVLALLPPGAVYRAVDGWDEDDDDDPAFVIHYWEEAPNRTSIAGGTAPASVGESG